MMEMKMKKVLICGHRSFVATGLAETMEHYGIKYDCFSRGEEQRKEMWLQVM